MERLSRSPWTWAPPLVALLLFALIALSGSNQRLFLFLNHAGQALGAPLWVNLTLLGDGAVALALVLPTIKRAPQCFWAAIIAALIATLWVQGTKQLINMPRPLAVLAPGQFFQFGPAYRAVSFPSGHAAAIFAITGIWIMRSPGRHLLRATLLALAVLVSVSRVMVGVHWPLDLLGGMLGGWLGAWAGLALLTVAAALLVSRHIGIPAVLPLQRALGMLCLCWGAWDMFRMLPRLQAKGK